jgi:cell division protein FtsB
MLPNDCIWVTPQYSQHPDLEEFVWTRMGEVMDQENQLRAVELQRYHHLFDYLLIISRVEQAQELRELQSQIIKDKLENERLQKEVAELKKAMIAACATNRV